MAMLVTTEDSMQLDFLDNSYIELSDEFYEVENLHHEQIVQYQMKQDLLKGKLKYKCTKSKLIDWFNEHFFLTDLEVSCYDLFNIAIENNVTIKDLV